MDHVFLKQCSTVAQSLRARALSAERERQIPTSSIADLSDLGIFRAFTPHRYGGEESALLPVFNALIQLAAACPSTGWVASLLALHSFLLCFFSDRVQQEVWATGPSALIASSVAPSGRAKRTQRGFLVRGTWSFASGIDHCNWVFLTTLLRESPAGSAQPYILIVPSTDFTITDDWYVAGLAATGSKSVTLNGEVFIPSYRAELLSRVTTPLPLSGTPSSSWLLRIPWQPLFTCGFAAVALGTAWGTLDYFRDYIRTRRAPYTGLEFRSHVPSLLRFAEASADYDMAYLILERDLSELQQYGKSDHPLPQASFERMLFDVPYIVNSCGGLVSRLFTASGGRALFQNNPLQRFFRDMHAITQHAALDFDVAGERYGKFLVNKSQPDFQ